MPKLIKKKKRPESLTVSRLVLKNYLRTRIASLGTQIDAAKEHPCWATDAETFEKVTLWRGLQQELELIRQVFSVR